MFGSEFVNKEDIAFLADMLKDKGLGEISVKAGEVEIAVKGEVSGAVPPALPYPRAEAPAATEKPDVSGNEVKAPLIGTFYASPAPDKPPFVTVGQTVKKGDALMIIESMKLMNEVHSEFDGIVAEILVENASPVEFDQTIMIIR